MENCLFPKKSKKIQSKIEQICGKFNEQSTQVGEKLNYFNQFKGTFHLGGRGDEIEWKIEFWIKNFPPRD